MDPEANAKRGVLENMLSDANAEPTDLPFSLLEYITKGFADDMQIGNGGFAVVYKGELGNGMVAVKKLSKTYGIHEKQFKKEVKCLLKAKHKNIVRFLGYCSETRGEMSEYEGRSVMADVRQRLLCFEYLCNGSLDKHITGASCVLEWRKLYRIVKGICEGLYYLHVERNIVHADLKAQNILLDDNMDPKIADFGVSRSFGKKQSQTFTSNVIGTFGYMAPECLDGKITFKTDIYSLGVIIIEILTGEKGHRDVNKVLDIWRKRFQQSHEDIQLKQIRVCAQIGIECTLFDPTERPNIQNIIDRLDGIASMDQFIDTNVSSSSAGQVMATTLLVFYGKSSEDGHEGESIGSVITVQGLTQCGYLHAIGEDGKSYEMHPDGNRNLIQLPGLSFIASHDKFLDASAEPRDLPLSLLKYITKNFSHDRKIGLGGASVVYKGSLGNRLVAVKKLNETLDILEDNFIKEVGCLMKTKHENIVRFMGYCSDTRAIIKDYGEEIAMADVRQWLLCFEYLSKGSLRKYISGDSCTLGWTECYEIIKGICEGLRYLHVNRHIVHLDLKPENILLADNMVPKIADFGLSRCFGENQSQAFTSNPKGSTGYLAPECLGGDITFSSDIYSLGVIIRELVAGKKGHRDIVDVLNIWKEKLEQSHQDMQLEQIRVCMEIGIDCAKNSPAERPDIQSIIDRLNGTEYINTRPPNTVQGEASSEVMATTLLVLSGKSSQDQHHLASAATSLSLHDSEISVSLASDVSGDSMGFDMGAYMGALRSHCFGRWIIWSPWISSTHDLVLQNFAKLPMGVVCVADTQFKGRGFLRNVWQSPPGCLMFSFTLQMHDARKVVFIQYIVCIAMIEAINQLFCAKGFPELVKIKWPSDIYLKGSKVGGILCTTLYSYKSKFDVCVGIGLNVDNMIPTTCLNAELRKLKANSPRLKQEEILSSFFNKFEIIFETLSHEGFPALEKRYYNQWLHSGQVVLVQHVHEGQALESMVTIEGLTPGGYLYAIGEDGKKYELHPDGNSYDFFTGLVRREMAA